MTVKEFFQQDRFATLNDMELVEWGSGYAKTRLTVAPKHCNAVGFCQGGAIFTLADLAFAVAVNSHGTVTVATNSTINFIRSAKLGATIFAEAREIVNHHRLPYAEIRVTDDEENLLAVITTTGYRKEGQTMEFNDLK